jgi:thioredoxin reductase
MKVNLENIKKNLIIEINEQSSVLKVSLKTILPSILGAVILHGTSTQISKMACNTVVTNLSNSLYYTGYGVLAIGSLAFMKCLNDHYDKIEGKKVQYVKIPKKDFDLMNKQILSLRAEVEQNNKMHTEMQRRIREEKNAVRSVL